MSKCQVRVSWRRRGIGAGIDEVTRADRLDSNRGRTSTSSRTGGARDSSSSSSSERERPGHSTARTQPVERPRGQVPRTRGIADWQIGQRRRVSGDGLYLMQPAGDSSWLQALEGSG